MTVHAPPRPVALKLHAENIPGELKAVAHWVIWRYTFQRGKWQKPPIAIRTGRPADANDPAVWTTFDDALKHYDNRRRKLDGVGFVFTDDDPYSGIDLDECRDPGSGELQPWAEEIVCEVCSYTEVSPSGTGVKIVVRGKLPPGSKTRKGRIEVYSRAHYFTLTGNRLPGSPTAVWARQDALEGLYEGLFGGDDPKGPGAGQGGVSGPLRRRNRGQGDGGPERRKVRPAVGRWNSRIPL
jgi:primase-polymerase (primpol)-like protein